MPIALNPESGEAVYLNDAGEWQPAKIAVNPQTQERLAFDGKGWMPLKTDAPVTAGGLAKATGIGMAKGGIGLAGFLGDVTDLGAKGIANAVQLFKPDAPGYDPAKDRTPIPNSASIQKFVEGYTGEFRKPQNTAEQFGQTIGEFVPAALAGPGGLGRRVVTQAIAPGIASETAGQMAKDTALEPYARVAGAFAPAAAGAAGRRLATPFPVAPTASQHAGQIQTLQNEGVRLTAGDATGSKGLRYMESAAGDMPGSSSVARNIFEGQAEDFTAAALRRAGENARRATPDTVDNMFTRIGQSFDDLAARTTVPMDTTIKNEVRQIANKYENVVALSNRAPIIANIARDIENFPHQNMIGDAYKTLHTDLSKLVRGSSSPEVKEAAREMLEAFTDAITRSNANPPGLRTAWQTTRREYRNALVIEKAVKSAAGADGLITPSALRTAAKTMHGRGFVRGQSDFTDLANAGVSVLKALPNSGTAPRLWAQHLLGAGLGGGLGGIPGAALGLAMPGIGGRLLLSNRGQQYLANQRFAAPPNRAGGILGLMPPAFLQGQ